MKTTLAFMCAALFALVSFGALAQENVQDVTEYKFDDEHLMGEIVGPPGDLVRGRGKAKSKTLIKVRKHFVPEMLKAVEDI